MKNQARIEDLCRYIEAHADRAPDLADLAARSGLSRFHVQRTFKAAVGLTPKQYAEAYRMRRLKRSLRQSRGVAEAVYDAGFGSGSRVYERADTRLGMTPDQYRKGGAGITITYVPVEHPLGPPLGKMLLGATDRGICYLQFGDSEEEMVELLRKEYAAARLERMAEPYPPEFERWNRALMRYLAGDPPEMDLPLDIRATAFQMRVWNYLQSIPRGQVQSYREVAEAIGQPTAARAVARACASNRVALLIPCHRVIRGTGELGGYRWGMVRKRVLLDSERTGGKLLVR
jgi:AraC family transcriptional regulator of adaptative response/methylated-DNA-[protein]-cysteine methyltransferase